ncbi:MAG: NUDIX domain-containing protein [Mycobacteriales bacterium]
MSDEVRRHPTPDELPEFFAGLAKILTAAGLLIRHRDGRVLIVRPTYREGWQLPGGMVEADEPPSVAAGRETEEEVGLRLPVGRLLSVAYRRGAVPVPDNMQLVFDGGEHDEAIFAGVVLDDFELAEWRLVTEAEVVALTRETGRPRVIATFRALRAGTTAYLEDGAARP